MDIYYFVFLLVVFILILTSYQFGRYLSREVFRGLRKLRKKHEFLSILITFFLGIVSLGIIVYLLGDMIGSW